MFTIQGKSHAAFTRTQQLSNELAQRFPSANRGSGQIILTTGDGTALTELQKVMSDIESANLHGATVQFDANLSEPALGGGCRDYYDFGVWRLHLC